MEAGKHGFSGMCRPGVPQQWSGMKTFSVGIFQWVPKWNGRGLKKSPVIVRVSGYVSDPDAVDRKAQEIVDLLDKGEYTGPKRVKLKR